jgi:hypothetical protein
VLLVLLLAEKHSVEERIFETLDCIVAAEYHCSSKVVDQQVGHHMLDQDGSIARYRSSGLDSTKCYARCSISLPNPEELLAVWQQEEVVLKVGPFSRNEDTEYKIVKEE